MKVVHTHRQTDHLSERANMATNTGDERETGAIRTHIAERETFDPRDTDHPAGTAQAAENAANESPS